MGGNAGRAGKRANRSGEGDRTDAAESAVFIARDRLGQRFGVHQLPFEEIL